MVGNSVGNFDGLSLGLLTGDVVGVSLGDLVGNFDGLSLGLRTGDVVGVLLGDLVGFFVGDKVGVFVGEMLGKEDCVGEFVGGNDATTLNVTLCPALQ